MTYAVPRFKYGRHTWLVTLVSIVLFIAPAYFLVKYVWTAFSSAYPDWADMKLPDVLALLPEPVQPFALEHEILSVCILGLIGFVAFIAYVFIIALIVQLIFRPIENRVLKEAERDRDALEEKIASMDKDTGFSPAQITPIQSPSLPFPDPEKDLKASAPAVSNYNALMALLVILAVAIFITGPSIAGTYIPKEQQALEMVVTVAVYLLGVLVVIAAVALRRRTKSIEYELAIACIPRIITKIPAIFNLFSVDQSRPVEPLPGLLVMRAWLRSLPDECEKAVVCELDRDDYEPVIMPGLRMSLRFEYEVSEELKKLWGLITLKKR